MIRSLKHVGALLLFSSALYFLSFLLGIFLGNQLKIEKCQPILDTNPMVYIVHNLNAILFFLMGLITMGLSALCMLIINGFNLGFSLSQGAIDSGLATAILKILPHGIFEIPAILIAGTIGLYPIHILIQYLKGNKLKNIIEWKALFILMAATFILIFIAGAIEAWITPFINQ